MPFPSSQPSSVVFSDEEEDEDEETTNAGVAFIESFDSVSNDGLKVTESLIRSTLEGISKMKVIDAVVEILVEWAITEFPASRDWNTLRFAALVLGGVYRMSPPPLRRELMLLLTLESLPWHVRLLIGTHLLQNDPFDQINNNSCPISDPLLTLVGKIRRDGEVEEIPHPDCDKYGMELVARLMLGRDEGKVKEYRKNFDEVELSLKKFIAKYPWAKAPTPPAAAQGEK